MKRTTKMLLSIFSRALGGGKAPLLTVVVALTLATVTPAFAANGSNFILGSLNNSATAITRLVGNVNGPSLLLYNPNTGSSATAALFQVASGHPPFKVNSATKVANLNADKLDGLDSSQLAGSQAYAHIDASGTLDASRSKNVNRSLRVGEGVYCVNSTVRPHNVVATIDTLPGLPFGEIAQRSANGATICSAGTTTYNIVVFTASSSGTNEDREFDVAIN